MHPSFIPSNPNQVPLRADTRETCFFPFSEPPSPFLPPSVVASGREKWAEPAKHLSFRSIQASDRQNPPPPSCVWVEASSNSSTPFLHGRGKFRQCSTDERWRAVETQKKAFPAVRFETFAPWTESHQPVRLERRAEHLIIQVPSGWWRRSERVSGQRAE